MSKIHHSRHSEAQLQLLCGHLSDGQKPLQNLSASEDLPEQEREAGSEAMWPATSQGPVSHFLTRGKAVDIHTVAWPGVLLYP